MSKRTKDRRHMAEDESAIQDYSRKRSTNGLNAITTNPIQGLNQLQGSQARFRAPKPTSRLAGPFARKHNRSKAQPLESTTARKHNRSKAQWLVSRRNGSQAENPPLHGSQPTSPAKPLAIIAKKYRCITIILKVFSFTSTHPTSPLPSLP
jgi:hypothetical protein